MILVFIILTSLYLIVMFSRIEIRIENLYINNKNKQLNNKDLIISILLKLWKIPIIKISLNNKKIANLYAKQKIKNSDKKKNNMKIENLRGIIKDKKLKNEIKEAKITLEEINLNLDIGLEDCIATSYIIAIICTAISNVLPYIIDEHKKPDSYKYKIMPIYVSENLYKVNFNCIINAKLVHIINIIYLIKRRSDKNERTSNRKSYDYSYE